MKLSQQVVQLMRIAEAVGELKERLVFVGGGIVDVLISDPEAPPSRPTIDVDAIVNVSNLADYYELGARLKMLGFGEDSASAVICRWRLDDLIFDLMPSRRDVLGFGNTWYESAVRNALVVRRFLADRLSSILQRRDLRDVIEGNLAAFQDSLDRKDLVIDRMAQAVLSASK